jgi:hypothetical protein
MASKVTWLNHLEHLVMGLCYSKQHWHTDNSDYTSRVSIFFVAFGQNQTVGLYAVFQTKHTEWAYFEHTRAFSVFMWLDVLTAVKMSMLVFWVATPCGLVGRYQRLGGKYSVHLKSWYQPWSWRQYVPPKRCCIPTSRHCVTTQKIKSNVLCLVSHSYLIQNQSCTFSNLLGGFIINCPVPISILLETKIFLSFLKERF